MLYMIMFLCILYILFSFQCSKFQPNNQIIRSRKILHTIICELARFTSLTGNHDLRNLASILVIRFLKDSSASLDLMICLQEILDPIKALSEFYVKNCFKISEITVFHKIFLSFRQVWRIFLSDFSICECIFPSLNENTYVLTPENISILSDYSSREEMYFISSS